jgi:hypothetical protein
MPFDGETIRGILWIAIAASAFAGAKIAESIIVRRNNSRNYGDVQVLSVKMDAVIEEIRELRRDIRELISVTTRK